jgi:hypothetical protein
MAFDAVLISFGLSRLLALKGLLPGPAAYAPMGLVAALNLILLYSYFAKRSRLGRVLAKQGAEAVGDQAR